MNDYVSIRRFRTAIAIFSFPFLLISCEHKELCEHHSAKQSVRVVFDWRDAPQADPGGMVLYMYDSDSGKSERFDFSGKEGGRIEIEPGNWHLVSYNNDTEAVSVSGQSAFDSHFLFTREGNPLEGALGNSADVPPRAKGAEDELVRISPDMLWGCSEERHPLIPAPEKETVITLFPHQLVCTYSFEIRNVKNLGRVTQMCGVITGMAPGLYPSDESLHIEPTTIPFPAQKGDKTTITGSFLTFGHHDEVTDPHRMLIYVWMDNGEKYVYGIDSQKFDVTSHVHSAPDRLNVHIVIDGLDLPTPIDNGSGFKPSADDWIDENHDIEL